MFDKQAIKNKIDLPKSPFKVIESTSKEHKKQHQELHKSPEKVNKVVEQPQTKTVETTNQQSTNTKPQQQLSSSEESAKQEIAMAESSNSYTAVNGRYYGKYQLDISYLHGDLSPANQERVFLQYCNQRYGSVQNALVFRHIHNWY